ncbi:MAG: hypothetical protein SGILL_002619 [Bacillariaceae sp.]
MIDTTMGAATMSDPWNSPHGRQPQPHAHPGLLQYYESQMRNHAAAYANAAAAAAMTAAQLAAGIAASSAVAHQSPNDNFGHQPNPHPPLFAPMMPAGGTPPGQQQQPGMPFQQAQGMPFYSPQSNHPDGSPNFYVHGPGAAAPHHHSDDHTPPQDAAGNHRRRKRHQRVNNGSTETSNHKHRGNQRRRNTDNGKEEEAQQMVLYQNNPHQVQQGNQKRGRRRRYNLSDGGSSGSDPSYRHNSNSMKRNNTGSNRRRNRKTALASSSSDGGSASWTTKKKQKQQETGDESLLGKTGAGALYEWCDKRKIKPVFECNFVTAASMPGRQHETKNPSDQSSQEGEEEISGRISTKESWYEMKLFIDGIEMGTGRGSTKTGAKHDASRNALQVLFPGVKFDRSSGIIVKIPIESQTESSSRLGRWSAAGGLKRNNEPAMLASTTSTCLDDLAPNLAKQLAIAHPDDDDEEGTIDNESSDLSGLGPKLRGQWPYVYPGTSTTSDDDDDNSYFAARGASVCSSLLHAMVQIDERLTDPPEYSYEVTNLLKMGVKRGDAQLKRKDGVRIDATSNVSVRGSFQCTGMLKIRVGDDSLNRDLGSLEVSLPRESYQLLRAVGCGATKREARHVTAAKLLALLFPDCDGMSQVKQAAEAAREKYAASRAMKQESKQSKLFAAVHSSKNGSPTNASDLISPSFDFAVTCEGTPPIPQVIELGLGLATGSIHQAMPNDCTTDCTNQNISPDPTTEFSARIRQLSRQEQLEEKVAGALQMLNEHDDEGRSLPQEPTVDDVGRTVLRCATVDDLTWIENLFGVKTIDSPVTARSPLNVSGISKRCGPAPSSLWSSSTVVLLLCRAIAPHEDPPLGCAVLNVGFSMRQGKLLRLVQMASQPHLPRERFIECLLSFAVCMGSVLDTSIVLETNFTLLRKDTIGRILSGHLPSFSNPDEEVESKTEKARNLLSRKVSRSLDDTLVQPSLQSVQEEEGEGCEESDGSQKKKTGDKVRDKPSKRSRFE